MQRSKCCDDATTLSRLQYSRAIECSTAIKKSEVVIPVSFLDNLQFVNSDGAFYKLVLPFILVYTYVRNRHMVKCCFFLFE